MYSKSKNIKLCIFIILLSIAICKVIIDNNLNSIIDAKEDTGDIAETISLGVMVDQEDYVLQRIIEKYKNSNIEVYYPVTKYELLNKEINSIIDTKISKFKENVKDDIKYSILINYDVYRYENYIGFVFNTLEDYAGAHPNSYIFTVNYNIKNNSVINIDTLVNQNNNILNLMSKYTYTNLSNSSKMKEINMPSMLINGTKPTKNNFKNFVYTKYGIIIFFEKYQVAPYAYGEFCITIPYEEINLKISD
jgi:hypothetical protein